MPFLFNDDEKLLSVPILLLLSSTYASYVVFCVMVDCRFSSPHQICWRHFLSFGGKCDISTCFDGWQEAQVRTSSTKTSSSCFRHLGQEAFTMCSLLEQTRIYPPHNLNNEKKKTIIIIIPHEEYPHCKVLLIQYPHYALWGQDSQKKSDMVQFSRSRSI